MPLRAPQNTILGPTRRRCAGTQRDSPASGGYPRRTVLAARLPVDTRIEAEAQGMRAMAFRNIELDRLVQVIQRGRQVSPNHLCSAIGHVPLDQQVGILRLLSEL